MLEFKYVINAEHEMNQCSEARSDKYSFKLDINGSNCANKKSLSNILRACSYDPAYRDVSLTDDLASYLFSYKILHCVHMRKGAGPLAEISFEFAEIIGRRDENFSR